MTYFVILIVVLIIVYSLFATVGHQGNRDDFADPLNPEQIKKRRENLEKILELALKAPRLTNDQVQKALSVSDTAATRYLTYLTDLGKLIRIGERGQQVYYKINSNK
ncbi:MAG: DUF977 family protein [Candidatus Doudnabacteria bacterium]|nr:DUF977 family protein [Candidatus Doudnabacteria bacterium]